MSPGSLDPPVLQAALGNTWTWPSGKCWEHLGAGATLPALVHGAGSRGDRVLHAVTEQQLQRQLRCPRLRPPRCRFRTNGGDQTAVSPASVFDHPQGPRVTSPGEGRAQGASCDVLRVPKGPLLPCSSRSSSQSWTRTTCAMSSGGSASRSIGPTCTSCTMSTSPLQTTRMSPWSPSSPWTGMAHRPRPPHSPLTASRPREKGEGRRDRWPCRPGHYLTPLPAQRTEGSCLSVMAVVAVVSRMEGGTDSIS